MDLSLMDFLPHIVGTAVAGGAASKSLLFVKEGERGGLLRFGKFLRVVDPGFVLVIPFVHELRRVHVRQTTLSLAAQTITLKDNLSYEVQAVVLFRVTDVYHALFEMADLYQSIKDIGGTILRERLSAKASDNLHSLKDISEELKASLHEATQSWGIEILSFQLADVAPTAETARVLVQPELAKAQVAGNTILVEGIAALGLTEKLKGIPHAVVAALLLRGSGVPAVNVGNDVGGADGSDGNAGEG